MHVACRGGLFHPELQRTVDAGYGQGFVQAAEDVGARVGVFQKVDQQGGRQVVVVGQPDPSASL